MDPPPPPPPPHGAGASGTRSGGLPDGKYDIFVIPPSSAGSGFFYLPSLNTQRNSFLAGVVCTAAAFFVYQTAVPVVKQWFFTTVNGGGSGVFMLVIGVGVISWALGKTQGEGARSSRATGQADAGSQSRPEYSAPPPHSPPPSSPSPPPGPEPRAHADPPPQASSPPPKSSWQRAQGAKTTADARSSWEKAKEETRKREEEKRRTEEIKRRKEELEKERLRQREREARERLERELKEKRDREAREAQLTQEKKDRERKEQEDRDRREKEQLERIAKLEQERKDRESAEREKAAKEEEGRKKEAEQAKANLKRPPIPTAATERDDDAYSFRPYDRPKRSAKTNSAGSVYSEDSYAPSATTAKTTPPPSVRGPYTTKDPDKIIIKAVYAFNTAFQRTPIAQLVSGSGNVTDGLILRITTEGLFIDDDVRGVPQREWDIKAWTMKLAEVL